MDAWARARRFVPAAEAAIQLDPIAHAPVSSRVEEAVRRCAALWLAGDEAAEAVLAAEARRVRSRAAELLGVAAEEIALFPDARGALEGMLRRLDWRPGDRIVHAAGVDPPDILVRKRGGVEQRPLPAPDPAVLERALGDRRVRLVLLASADPESGAGVPLSELGRLCREAGVPLCVDATPTLGRLALAPRDLGVDLLVANGRGGLLSVEGAALAFSERRVLAEGPPLGIEAPASPSVFALGAAVDLLLELGPVGVARRVQQLARRLAEGLGARGFATAAGAEAGVAVFRCGSESPARTRERLLTRHGIRVGLAPLGVRAAPHFYNTEAEIDALLEAL